MKKTFVCSLMLMGLLTVFGCGSKSTGLNANNHSTVNTQMNDLKVKIGWGRAEQYKLIVTAGYNTLLGIVRTEILSNGNQTVVIHYSIDGINWLQIGSKKIGLTDDSNFTTFYFQTPELITDTNLVGSVNYQFYVEYRTDSATYLSDAGEVFQCTTRPDKTLPDGVIGQAAPGYSPLVLENAKLIVVTNASGTWVSNSFQGHIQVKNDAQNSEKEVRVTYRVNSSSWDQNNYRNYDFTLARKLVKSFYANNSDYGIENWVFSVMLPRSDTSITFINSVSNMDTGVYMEDNNRGVRYLIDSVPGVMISHQTNFRLD